MEETYSIKYGKSNSSGIKKIYQKPEIFYLGELAIGRGADCLSGSGAIGGCENGGTATVACLGGSSAVFGGHDCLSGGTPTPY